MDTFEIREIAQEVYALIKSFITKSNTDRWMDMKELGMFAHLQEYFF